LVSRVLDASAFYAGIPFGSQIDSYTTPNVYDEIKHIKRNHDALGILLETKRLRIIDPEKEYTDVVIKMSKTTGDFSELSKEDVSSIALCLQLNGELITDDFAVSNVSKSLGLKISPIMTSGIKHVGKWIYYCPGCHKNFYKSIECPICGNQLRKKLIKNKSSEFSINKRS
jgi:endoribonuclease Nob1